MYCGVFIYNIHTRGRQFQNDGVKIIPRIKNPTKKAFPSVLYYLRFFIRGTKNQGSKIISHIKIWVYEEPTVMRNTNTENKSLYL